MPKPVTPGMAQGLFIMKKKKKEMKKEEQKKKKEKEENTRLYTENTRTAKQCWRCAMLSASGDGRVLCEREVFFAISNNNNKRGGGIFLSAYTKTLVPSEWSSHFG